MKQKSLLAQAKDAAKELKKDKNVMAIVLFGSHAKGTQKPLSDIDVAVMLKKPTKMAEANVAGFGSKFMDISNFHRLPLYVQFEALKYGKPLFIRDKKYMLDLTRHVVLEYLDMSYFYEKMKGRILA